MPDWETAAWPRAEHLQRVFQVRSGRETGTGFALDIDVHQYLVTALLVAEQAVDTASLDIYRGGQWTAYPVSVVGFDFNADVVVFALQERIVAANLDIDVNGAGCVAGQEVFFLGYPLGIRGHLVTTGFPLPLVKRGNAALFLPGSPARFFMSGSANPGFSGGPVYFVHHQTGRATLAAIVIEEYGYEVPVKNDQGNEIGKVLTGSNIVGCTYIDVVTNLIRANPIGFQL